MNIQSVGYKLLIAVLVIVVVIVVLHFFKIINLRTMLGMEEFMNDTDTELISTRVHKYTSDLNDVMGQPIGTPREGATLVDMPNNLNLIQGGGYNPSMNTDCERLNDANFMSKCSQTNPSFTVATSLLPKDVPETEWGVPDCVKNALQNQNYLSAAQRIGNNTSNGTLRNPSLDIRNEVPNPMTPVSIWNSSTIAPDLYKRDIE